MSKIQQLFEVLHLKPGYTAVLSRNFFEALVEELAEGVSVTKVGDKVYFKQSLQDNNVRIDSDFITIGTFLMIPYWIKKQEEEIVLYIKENDCIELLPAEQVTPQQAINYFVQKIGLKSPIEFAQQIDYPTHKMNYVMEGKYHIDSYFADNAAYYTGKSSRWWKRLKQL